MAYLKRILRKIIPYGFLKKYHLLLQMIACLVYRFPSRKLIVIGVTGTNGKTTTCNLIASILEAAGKKFGMTTTINFQIGEKVWKNETKMTTLGHFQIQKILRKMVKNACECAIIETSSHAIDQYRTWGIDYDLVTITNITPEHLDYHKTMENYAEVKSRLFENLSKTRKKKNTPKVIALNFDDASFSAFSQFGADKKYAYALSEVEEDHEVHPPVNDFEWVIAEEPELGATSTSFKLSCSLGDKMVKLSLPGRFNIYNALAAASLGLGLGLELDSVVLGLEGLAGVPGRMERIDEGQDFTVIIDYAVTPDSLEQLYESIKRMPHNNIIAVFGSAGERDRVKRPVMGEIVTRFADLSIITNEDPFWEDPMQIINEVAEGARWSGKKEGEAWKVIFDRREAIKTALEKAGKNDIVVITGKGAETTMAIKDERIPWDEREIVHEELRAIVAKNKQIKK